MALNAENLFETYARTRDREVRDRLVIEYQSFARGIARRYANSGEPVEDLEQVGIIGLINAIDRFDPNRGTKFYVYATAMITGEIRRYFRDKCWVLKVPRYLQERNYSVRKVTDSLSSQLGRVPTMCEIAETIGVSEDEAIEAVEACNAYGTISMETMNSHEPDSSPISVAELIGETCDDLEKVVEYSDLNQAIGCLDADERSVICLRFYEDMSQTEVAKVLDVHQMKVSRVQKKAIDQLKTILERTTDDHMAIAV